MGRTGTDRDVGQLELDVGDPGERADQEGDGREASHRRRVLEPASEMEQGSTARAHLTGEQARQTTHRLLVGGGYLHRPTGQRVMVVDHEYGERGRTGRLVVRLLETRLEVRFTAAAGELEEISGT